MGLTDFTVRFAAFVGAIILLAGIFVGGVLLDKEYRTEQIENPVIVSNPEPVLNAVAKTVATLTDGDAVLNILEFRGDTAVVEINGADTVAYKVR